MSGENCGGCGPNTCPPKSLVHDWKLVQLMNAQQCALGRESKVDFGGLDAKYDGRFAHVAAIRIVGKIAVANDAGAAADAVVPDHATRSLMYGIKLSDRPNWSFLDKLDGRDLFEAEFFRFGRYLARTKAKTTTIGHGAGVVTGTLEFEILIDLTRPDGDPERFIPVSALQAMGTQALSFMLRDDFATILRGTFNAASTLHATGVFQTDGTTPGIEVHASIVELDALNHPPRWALRNYERDATEGKLDHEDATHSFVVIRNRLEDHVVDGTYTSGAETAAQLIDGGQFQVGGREVLSLPLAASARWASRDIALQADQSSSYAARPVLFAGFGFPNVKLAESKDTPGFRMILPYTDRKSAPAGRVGFRIETLPLGKFRVLHEFVKCGGDDDVGAAAKTAGIQTFTRVKSGAMGAQIASSANHAKAIDPTGATLVVPDKVS